MPHASVNGVRLYYEERVREAAPRRVARSLHRERPALLAELRGGEHIDVNRLGELQGPALVLTAETSPDEIRSGSEAVGRAIPHARSVHVGGGHAIDPAGPDVLAFISELLARSVA